MRPSSLHRVGGKVASQASQEEASESSSRNRRRRRTIERERSKGYKLQFHGGIHRSCQNHNNKSTEKKKKKKKEACGICIHKRVIQDMTTIRLFVGTICLAM